MATSVYSNDMNILEQAKRLGPDNNVATIAEILQQTSEFLVDAIGVPANDIRSHVSHKRIEHPTVGVRHINEGSSQTYSRVDSQRDDIMLVEANPEIDEQLIDPMPNPKKSLNNEYKAFITAMKEYFAEVIFYGNPINDGEILGVANRFNDLSLDNVVGIGGTGADLTSLYMFEWDEMLNKLVYPRDHKSYGVEFDDKGKVRVKDTNNKPFWAYTAQMKMMFGFSNVDPRCVQRLANIESAGATNNLIDTGNLKHHELVRARNRLPNAGRNAVIYCNRDIKSQFDIYALDKANGCYPIKSITGEPVTSFQGIPIRLCEELLSTESAVA